MENKIKSKTYFNVKTDKFGEMYVKSDDLNIFDNVTKDELYRALVLSMQQFESALMQASFRKKGRDDNAS